MYLSSKIKGLTLIEILVSLVIIAILASVAIPYAEITVRRYHEIELKRSLRIIRTALDQFHDDWNMKLIPIDSEFSSKRGFPTNLNILVDGVKTNEGILKRYLRRIPRNPFADQALVASEHWFLLGYEDKRDTLFWNGKDVYDVRVTTDKIALDGSRYDSW